MRIYSHGRLCTHVNAKLLRRSWSPSLSWFRVTGAPMCGWRVLSYFAGSFSEKNKNKKMAAATEHPERVWVNYCCFVFGFFCRMKQQKENAGAAVAADALEVEINQQLVCLRGRHQPETYLHPEWDTPAHFTGPAWVHVSEVGSSCANVNPPYTLVLET